MSKSLIALVCATVTFVLSIAAGTVACWLYINDIYVPASLVALASGASFCVSCFASWAAYDAGN